MTVSPAPVSQVFINLPVSDLPRSIAFYEALGARVDPRFTDETAACLTFSDATHVMLLTHAKFAVFTPRPIPDARTQSAVLIALAAASRDAVGETVERGGKAGGRADPTPAQDHGFMLMRSVEDPDGHILEIMFMDLEAAMKAFAPPQAA